MAMGSPSDTDPNVWFCLAVQMDQNCVGDEAFQASHKLAYVTLASISLNSKTLTFSQGVLPSCFTHSIPMPGNPVPMDIDAARKAKALSDVCRCCGKWDTGRRTANTALTFILWTMERFRSSSRIGWLLETLLK